MTAGLQWTAIAAARAQSVPRVPFFVAEACSTGLQALQVGSVARTHLQVLARWPEALRVDDAQVTLTVRAAERTTCLAELNAALRAAGLIRAWRDETYPMLAQGSGQLLATIERAASRFWGTTTFGAHCNGYVADREGRPTHLWIARRSPTKATDPGLLDNLIGGGVPHGQSAAEAVLREGWEEAGLQPEQMRALQRGRVLRVARDIPEGFQLEEVSVFDLALPEGLEPHNQDGEVAELRCMPIAEALACAAGDAMTVDASLVTLDFALRQRLLPPAEHDALSAASATLWLPAHALG